MRKAEAAPGTNRYTTGVRHLFRQQNLGPGIMRADRRDGTAKPVSHHNHIKSLIELLNGSA
jgi:hypothetical protein